MKPNENKLGPGLLIISSIILIAGVLMLNSKEFHSIGIFETCAGVYFMLRYVRIKIGEIKADRKYKAEEPLRKQQEEEEKRHQFYLKCKSEGVTSLSTPTMRQKAELIARALGISVSMSGLENLFNETQEKYGAEERRQKEEELRKKRWKERKEEEQYSYYARYSGRDKRIAMLSDRLKTLRQAIQTNDPNQFNLLYSATQQKEHNWALWGGLASGAAGGAAGLATALDLQAKNTGIRAQNQANAAALAEFQIALMQKKKALESEASSCESALLDAKMKLISDIPESNIMKTLSFSNVKVDIHRETGAFKVKAHATVIGTIKKIEGRRTVIDGTIAANLIQDGRNVGSAKLVLPLYGINKEVDLEGMCCGSADASKPYTVEFTPYTLWIMEA